MGLNGGVVGMLGPQWKERLHVHLAITKAANVRVAVELFGWLHKFINAARRGICCCCCGDVRRCLLVVCLT